MSDVEQQVIAVLGTEPKHIDEIIAATGMPAGQVASVLVMLEIRKLVSQLPGKNFARQ